MRAIKALVQKVKQLLTGTYDVYSGHVQDKVRFDGGLVLRVDGDAWKMLFEVEAARQAAQSLKADSPEEDKKKAAMRFATAIFGENQAEKLMNFYHGDAGSMLGVCGQYINNRLIKKITRVQKRQK